MALKWQLNLSGPLGPGLSAVRMLTNLEAAEFQPIDGGFQWQLDPSGNCRQLTFNARNDILQLKGRDIVNLWVEGEWRFFGVAVRVPSLESPNSEAFTIVGALELLDRTILGNDLFENVPAWTVVNDLVQKYLPFALTYDPAQVGGNDLNNDPETDVDKGPVVTFFRPGGTLREALTDLSQVLGGVPFGVDGTGAFFMRPGDPLSHDVIYTPDIARGLEIQAEDTATRIQLRVLTGPTEGGQYQSFDNQNSDFTYHPYLPSTIFHTYTDPAHATYDTEAIRDVPAGVSVIRNATLSGSNYAFGTYWTDPQNFQDADKTTYASNASIPPVGSENPYITITATGKYVGVNFIYRYNYSQDPDSDFVPHIRLTIVHGGPGFQEFFPASQGAWELPTSSDPVEVFLFFPPSPQIQLSPDGEWRTTVHIDINGITLDTADFYRVYHAALLEVNPEVADAVAQSMIRVPYQTPKRLTIPGLTQARPKINLLGTPQGDQSAPAGIYEYVYNSQDRSTYINFGASGRDEVGEFIRFQAQKIATQQTQELQLRLEKGYRV